MAMVLTEEQKMLKEAAEGFFAERAPITSLRALRDTQDELGYDPSLWQEMTEMGFTAVLANGEDGFGYVGAAIVAEAMATTLAASPFMASSIVALTLLKRLDHSLVGPVMSGEAIVTLAVDESGHHAPDKTQTSAENSGETWMVSGLKTFVPEGHVADHIIVLANTSDGFSFFLVDKGAKGLIVDRTVMADSRNWAKVTFEKTPAILLGKLGEAKSHLTPTLDVANIIYSAELLGISEAAFAMTKAYLKERKQFGRIIGSFQGLQHRAAHLFSELALTRSAVLKAAQVADSSLEGLSVMASIAKARACKTAELATNEAIQMHGGIGMTDEYDVGFFIKRARAVQNLYGGYNHHVDRFASLSGY